jgi:hypothetical protein
VPEGRTEAGTMWRAPILSRMTGTHRLLDTLVRAMNSGPVPGS